jgi:MoxR-like ATPase
MKVKVGYPSFDDEVSIIDMASSNSGGSQKLNKVLPLSQLRELREMCAAVYIDPKIDRYIVSLVHATRNGDAYGLKGLIEWGASPRASIALKVRSPSSKARTS